MNLPNGCTQDMVDAQCSPIAEDIEYCDRCEEPYVAQEMYPWSPYSWIQRRFCDVYLCEYCVPRCEWRHNPSGTINLDLKPCGRIQSPTAQGPWCAEHERESEALEESEA